MTVSEEERQRIIDDEHLRLLTIGHYITGGLCVAFASMFIFHFLFIGFIAANPDFFAAAPGHPVAPPDGMMRILAVVLGLFIAIGWSFGGLTIYVGRCIKQRSRRTLTFVVACMNTIFVPFGTVLAVFTLIVMSRPSVRRLYGL
jgi:hypothetical protein